MRNGNVSGPRRCSGRPRELSEFWISNLEMENEDETKFACKWISNQLKALSGSVETAASNLLLCVSYASLCVATFPSMQHFQPPQLMEAKLKERRPEFTLQSSVFSSLKPNWRRPLLISQPGSRRDRAIISRLVGRRSMGEPGSDWRNEKQAKLNTLSSVAPTTLISIGQRELIDFVAPRPFRSRFESFARMCQSSNCPLAN